MIISDQEQFYLQGLTHSFPFLLRQDEETVNHRNIIKTTDNFYKDSSIEIRKFKKCFLKHTQ
jgi:hypothetical protein